MQVTLAFGELKIYIRDNKKISTDTHTHKHTSKQLGLLGVLYPQTSGNCQKISLILLSVN